MKKILPLLIAAFGVTVYAQTATPLPVSQPLPPAPQSRVGQLAETQSSLVKREITEIGTHEELMQHSGTYQRLYNMQFAAEDLVSTAGSEVALTAKMEGIA